jgi:hypothetical protein
VTDAGAHTLVSVDVESGRTETVVSDAPVGSPIAGRSWPAHFFASVATDGAGGFIVGCSGDGSLRTIRRS